MADHVVHHADTASAPAHTDTAIDTTHVSLSSECARLPQIPESTSTSITITTIIIITFTRRQIPTQRLTRPSVQHHHTLPQATARLPTKTVTKSLVAGYTTRIPFTSSDLSWHFSWSACLYYSLCLWFRWVLLVVMGKDRVLIARGDMNVYWDPLCMTRFCWVY